MSKDKALKSILLICICSMLCGCNASPVVSSISSSQEQTSDSSSSTASNSTQTTVLSTDTSESVQPEFSFPEFNFVPVLTEDEIEYMGIPYKDLTADQFIQLWAQCTREYNVQRLYLITYDNSSHSDEVTGTTELQDEQLIKELVMQRLSGEWQGRMLSMFSDVELHKCEDAPNGYYDNASEEEELHYYITYNNTWYDSGSTGTEQNTSWITLKKINGYWKIGVMMASSPYFLSPYEQTDDVFSESNVV